MEEQLLEAWAIHDRINRYVLDAIPPAALSAVSASKGRSVAEQLAHVHNVRLMWLKQAAPELLEGLEKIVLTLKQAGFPLDKKVAFGLWEWGVR